MRTFCLLLLLCGLAFAAGNYTIYVSPTVTHPQLAWLLAERTGSLDSIGTFTRKEWKNQKDFAIKLEAGEGDLWLGSVETIARARKKGCNVKLLVITGWQKWYLIGRRYLNVNSALRDPVDSAPLGNPAASLLRQCFPGNVTVHYVDIRLLALQIRDNKVSVALLPEPFATYALKRNTSLKRIVSLERLKAQRYGGKERVPWAAIAINENSPLYKEIDKYHDAYGRRKKNKIDDLISAVVRNADTMKLMSRDSLAAIWPAEYEKYVARDILKDSLPGAKYTLESTAASQVMDEIHDYLEIVAPELLGDKTFLSGLVYVPKL